MKKIIIAIAVLLCVGAGVVYFLRDRVSYQPDWYLEDTTTGQDLMMYSADLLERKIKSDTVMMVFNFILFPPWLLKA